ncbi:hypothetical protein ACVWYN_001749 [Pedobacter sp. UYP24]
MFNLVNIELIYFGGDLDGATIISSIRINGR